MGKAKTKAANLPVPQSDAEAMEAIARIGKLQREVARIEASLNDAIAKATEAAEKAAAPLRADTEAAIEGLKIYCEANRARLTDGGKTKTVEFATGKVSWRNRPASVKLRDKVEEIVARLKALKLARFIREKEEVDKDAMLKEPDVARTVAGVSIGSEGEDFAVEPLEAELKEVAS
jgi:phage host-nuclease inhibitor protein Gam